jgi:hypothetical protein
MTNRPIVMTVDTTARDVMTRIVDRTAKIHQHDLIARNKMNLTE